MARGPPKGVLIMASRLASDVEFSPPITGPTGALIFVAAADGERLGATFGPADGDVDGSNQSTCHCNALLCVVQLD